MGLDFRTILILLLIALLLFGATKLPQLARSLGRSARILKAETKGLTDEDPGEESGSTQSGTQTQQASGSRTDDTAEPTHGQGQQPPPSQAELPPGQRIVDEDGRPLRRSYDS